MARPREFDESTVVAAARDVFWTRGYSATSIDDLGEATGLGRGSLYNAFGDKHSLYLRALDEYCTEADSSIRDELRGEASSPFARLTGQIRAQAAIIAGDSERRGCLIGKAASEMAATDPDVARRVKRTINGWQRELASTIEAAQMDGDVTADHDAKTLASMVLAVLRGMDALGKAGASAATVRAAGEQVIALLARDPDAASNR